MIKHLIKKIILSIILIIVYFLLLVLLDTLSYFCTPIDYLFTYYDDMLGAFLFYVVVCIQALIWLCKQLESKKTTIICMFISFACIVHVFGFLVL